MAISFSPIQNSSKLMNTAAAVASKGVSQVTNAVASKIEGYQTTSITQVISQKAQTAMTAIGNFLRDSNATIKSVGISGGLSQAIGKIGVDGVSWGAASVEQSEKIMHFAHVGGEKALEGLEKVGHLMGTALGVTAILSGVRGLAASSRCYSRASAMDSCVKQLNTASPVQKQLSDDLKVCADLNRLRGKDKAICGAIDISVGTSTLVAGAFSGGVAAPFTGLIGWGAGQVVKNALRTYRTSQDSPSNQIQREQISHRLNQHAQAAKSEITSLSQGKPISADTQARLKAFQAAGLISSKIDTSTVSSALTKQLEKMTPEKIEQKFTENTETLKPEIKKGATPLQTMVAIAKTTILLAT